MNAKQLPTAGILLVESNAGLGARLGSDFQGEPFKLTVAHTPEEAEAMVVSGKFDLALIDLDVTDWDGVELTRRIRSYLPSATVVAMTDYGDLEIWVDLLNAGANDVICKPVRWFDVERHLPRSFAA